MVDRCKVKFVLLGIVSLVSKPGIAQVTVTVKDQATQQPIEYAQVALLRINEGAATNAQGMFALDNYALTDSVLISALGYRSEKFAVKALVASPVAMLARSPVALSEVVVAASRKAVKFHRQRLGWVDYRVNRFLNLNRVCVQKGARMVVWIGNAENQVGIIEALIVKLLPRPEARERWPALIRVCPSRHPGGRPRA